MKNILLKLQIILVLALLPSVLLATQYDTVLTGSNSPDIDISAVQNAVDHGGSILLKGVFEFGKDGTVKISKDVSIYGETDAQGVPRTKIKGGVRTFQTALPGQLPPQSPGPKIVVQNIHFEGATETIMFLPYCAGAGILNNKVTNLGPS